MSGIDLAILRDILDFSTPGPKEQPMPTALPDPIMTAFVRPIVESLRALVPEMRQEVLDEVIRQVDGRPRAPKAKSEDDVNNNRRVLAVLGETGEPESRGWIAKKAGCTPEETSTTLHRLIAMGLVVVEGTGRGAVYEITALGRVTLTAPESAP